MADRFPTEDGNGLRFAYVRSAAKDHGLGNLIEGIIRAGDKVVIVEDLISIGGSSLKAVEAVRAAGAEVLGMVAVFTYEFLQAQQAFAKAQVPLYTASNYSELLGVAVEQELFDNTEQQLLALWRENPAAWG